MPTALIIGGTGTLGNAITPRLLALGYDVTILSREEVKQKKMRAEYPEVKFVLGDIRDFSSLQRHCYHKDAVFHLAAMKHVDMAEENIVEGIKINLQGTMNVIDACRDVVNYAAFSSTDKAVLPINAYGMCKALSEKLWFDAGANFNVFRWGNVIGSRGSVIHNFVSSLQKEKKIYITSPEMSRFWIHIDDVAKFMISNFPFSNNGQPYIPEMKAAKLIDVARMTAAYLDIYDYKIERIPIRPGEKIHEWLDYHDPDHEWKSNTGNQYSDDELYALVERTLR